MLPPQPSLDIVGTLFAALGMGLLIYPLIQGRRPVGRVDISMIAEQLGGAIDLSGIGTLFFSTLEHSGYVTVLSHSLLVELAS